MPELIDFRSLNNILNSYKNELLPMLLPNGRIEGHEYTALNPRRHDTHFGSFRINRKSLVWCDFATGDKGSGFISLYSYIKDIKPLEAAKTLVNLVNISPSAVKWQGRKRYQPRRYSNSATLEEAWGETEPTHEVKQTCDKDFSTSRSFPPLDAGVKKLILKIWHSATDPFGTVVEQYLNKRGIKGEIPPTIRYLADCAHKATGTNWPCMIAAVTRWPERRIIALHRTYLKADGSDKAPVTQPKMMIGKTIGGAVRLSATANKLIVAEGIETALSLNFLSGSKEYSVWAVLTASGYTNLVLPPLSLTTSIIIAADNDTAGIKAAEVAATKWVKEGRKVKIAIPPKNNDFNDILVKDIWE